MDRKIRDGLPGSGDVAVEDRVEEDSLAGLRHPDEFAVVLLNDDYTPMDFVIMMLMMVFHKNLSDAERIMLEVHRKGKGVAGSYSYDIAVTKAARVHDLARRNGHPLRCVVEKI